MKFFDVKYDFREGIKREPRLKAAGVLIGIILAVNAIAYGVSSIPSHHSYDVNKPDNKTLTVEDKAKKNSGSSSPGGTDSSNTANGSSVGGAGSAAASGQRGTTTFAGSGSGGSTTTSTSGGGTTSAPIVGGMGGGGGGTSGGSSDGGSSGGCICGSVTPVVQGLLDTTQGLLP